MVFSGKCVKILILVVVVLVIFTSCADGQQGLPKSPCPSIFQYQFDGGEWIGVVVITGFKIGQTIRININLVLQENLPNNFPGTLELYYTRDQTLQNILANKPVVYKIRFPLQNILPQVTQIYINNQLICAGEADYGQLMSEIRLEHTLQTQVTGQPLANDADASPYQIIAPDSFTNRRPSNNGNFGSGDRNAFFDDFLFSRNTGELNFYPVSDSSLQQTPQRQPQSPPQQVQQDNLQYIVQQTPQSFNQPQQRPQLPQEPQQQFQQQPQQQFQQQPQQQFQQQPQQQIEQRPPVRTTTKRPKPNRTRPVQRKPSSSALQRPRPNQVQTETGIDSTVSAGDKLAEVNRICGKVDPKFNVRPLVVGGEEIRRGTWPWLVAIYLNLPTSLSFQCGGSLISNRLVLTSAHCFYGSRRYTAQDVVLFLGRHNIRNWNETGSVSETADGLYLHPDYKHNQNTFDADIAIILLRGEARFSSYIRPACLWPRASTTEEIVGSRGIVVGWGRNEAGLKVNNVPKKVEATVVSDLQCIRSNEQFRVLTSNRTFCAGDRDGQGPCTGDSGGGFMIYRDNRWYLRGTVSASLSDTNKSVCNLNEYVIYVDVSRFLEWVKSFMLL